MEYSMKSLGETKMSEVVRRPESDRREWYERDGAKVQSRRLDEECKNRACQRSTNYKKSRRLTTQSPYAQPLVFSALSHAACRVRLCRLLFEVVQV